MADDPPYLTVGTEVSAKYKGAFCEAKIRKVVRTVKCKVTFKGAGNGSCVLPDDQIKGTLRVGANVEAKHPDKNQYLEATINKIQDSSQYTVVFDDGDITTLRRSALCLKSGRHFNESETLDQLPLTHPEHFSNPVVGGRRGVRRRAADKDESSDEDEEDTPTKKDGRKKYEKELDMGKVVCVESTDKKKSKDTWFPALVVSPAAQETVKIRIKDEYLVRSFRDGRYYTVPKKEITEFTKDSSSKYDSNSNVLRAAVEKALSFLEKNELPPHWDREVLFGNARQSESGEGEEQLSDDDASEDDPRNEEKDRFIAQLYKFMDDRGTPLNKVPMICNKELDLYKIYQVVTGKGGYTKVTNQGQWKNVVIKMGYGNMPSTSTINLVKQAYKKSLVGFEDFYRKLGCTWTPRSTASTTSKSRSSRSLFRDRATPSSSRESSKKGDDEDGRSTPSKKESNKDSKDKEKTSLANKEKESKEEKAPAPAVEADSPKTDEVESESSAEIKQKPPEITVEEPRKSSRGRQPKKIPDDEETASPSARKKRKVNASVSRDRDSSVASSTKEEKESSAPPTPSGSTASTTPVKKGVGRGKYKRHGSKTLVEKEEEKPEPAKVVKEEEKVVEIEKPASIVKTPGLDIKLGDKLKVYYPKSEGDLYEAKVIDIDANKEKFLVHYLGWNNRYDEWIDRDRVSEKISFEQSAEADKVGATAASAIAKGKDGPGVKQRKGRNSSSATSTTSASSVTTTTSTAPSGTRSGGVKGSASTAAASGSVVTSSSPVSSKRRRSTSTEVAQAALAPKRRRTRQKSGQESGPPTTTSAGPGGSDSEPETSDSDGKSIKSDVPSPLKPAKDKESSVVVKESEKDVETKPTRKRGEDAKATLPKPEKKVDEDEEASAVKSNEAPNKIPVEDSKDSTTSSSGSSTGAQVIDLDQIRSEMKGLEKMVKATTERTGSSSSSVSSPAPPTLLAAVGGTPPSESTKVDIYEFQEDGSDDQAIPITASAPKLKMFSPVARTVISAVSTEKSPVVSASSAEAVAKLMSTDQEKDKPVPIVTLEKMDKDRSSTTATTTAATLTKPSSEVVPNEVSTTKATPKEPKDLCKVQIAPTPKSVLPPAIHPVTTTVSTPYPPAQVTLSPAPASTVPSTTTMQSTPALSLLTTTSAPIPVISTVISSPFHQSSAQTTVPSTILPANIPTNSGGPTPVIISSAALLKVKAAAESVGAAARATLLTAGIPGTAAGSSPTPISISGKSPITSSYSTPSILIPSPVLTSSQLSSSITVTMTTASVPISSTPTPIVSAPSLVTISSLSSVSSPPPPVLIQQQRPVTLSSNPTVLTPTAAAIAKPILTPVVAATVAASAVNKGADASNRQPQALSSKKPEMLFPHLLKQASTTSDSVPSITPTISIIASSKAPELEKDNNEKLSIVTPVVPPVIPVSISLSTQQQTSAASTKPVKVAVAIPPPPPPPVVLKAPPPVVSAKPVFGPGPPSLSSSPITPVQTGLDPPKKKKKTKVIVGSTTPIKQLAPLPAIGAPPPPPVVISTPSTISVTSTSNTTPGRKTPVKKRIPPPIDSSGKPLRSNEKPTPTGKPGKMNPEEINAAIASVGATPPLPMSVPTTVITSTSATLFQGSHTSHGLLFTTGSPTGGAGGQLPPPPAPPQLPPIVTKPIGSVTIKSSAESIAASIAAVASMGSTMSPTKSAITFTPTSSGNKSGPPIKRFMKETSERLVPGNKDNKIFSISPVSVSCAPTSLSSSQCPVVITKPITSEQSQLQQQSSQHTPPPITIQAKFQSSHQIGTAQHTGQIPTGPAVTFVKAPSGPSPTTSGPHHILDATQVHPPQNLPKHPVIIIPAAPVVIKPASFQHGPMIMTKQMHVDGPRPLTPSPAAPQEHQHQPPSQPPPTVLVSSTPSSHGGVKPAMLPITVTPSSVQVSSVPVSLTVTPIQALSSSSSTSCGPAVSVSQCIPAVSLSAVEMKPVQELPPTITVTKTTTVMKSISPDIVAVSSYCGSSRNSNSMGFTPVKQEPRSDPRKEPEIVVKPAPASAQIVFHTAADTKKVEVIRQIPTTTPISTPYVPVLTKSEVKEPEENSLLCEEIIPGSPATGEDLEEKLEEDKSAPKDKNDKIMFDEVKDQQQQQQQKPPEIPARASPSPPVNITVGGNGGGGAVQKPVIVLGPKLGEDLEDFIMEERRSFKFGDDDDDDNKLEERSVDSPMGPPSEGREADLPFRDSFSDGGDHSPPSSPSSGSTISTDDSSRQHDTSRLSPTPEGGSSKSKDSDDEDMDSDVGSKSTHLDDADSKHGSTRGSTRIRNQTSRLGGRSPSPPLSKKRRILRRNKSPEEMARYTRTIRTSSGRKVTPTGRGADMMRERELEREIKQPPPPLINLAKPPKTGRYNFIPNLNSITDPDQRIAMITQSINDLKEQYQKTKNEAASFDRRVKRWKRRIREKERQARQEATRSAS